MTALPPESLRAPRDDLSQPFQLEASRLRGRIVRVGGAVDAVLARHAYPEPVSTLLGELLVLAASLAGALKFDGVFSLQTRSDGPVSLMVADCTNEGALRAYASFDAERLPKDGAADIGRVLGDGVLALTVDQAPLGESYQGIVELTGTSLADCMHAYFRRSEQVATGLRMAVAHDADAGRWRAGGVVVQRMPDEAEGDLEAREGEDDWRRTMMLLGTLEADELLDPDLAVETVLYRLFHEEGVRLFEPRPLHFGCRCSRERVERLLGRFPDDELDGMKREDGRVSAVCQFCSAEYLFDEAELADLGRAREREH